MSVTARILYPCNHVVINKIRETGVINMTRSDISSNDMMDSNIYVSQIASIYAYNNDETIFYDEHYNFEIVNNRIIQWLDGSVRPANGSTYFVECIYQKTEIIQYESAEECKRCLGNGWYISLFPEDELTANTFAGTNKMVQDFLKILYTEEDSQSIYGSNVMSLIGKEVNDANGLSSEVVNSINDCVEKFKAIQSDAQILGVVMTDEEILRTVSINDIEYDVENTSLYISLDLITMAGTQRTMSLIL